MKRVGLVMMLAMGCSSNPDWEDVQNRPSGLDDGDDVASYQAGTGLTLSDDTLSVNQSQVETWATDAVTDSGNQVAANGGTAQALTVTSPLTLC